MTIPEKTENRIIPIPGTKLFTNKFLNAKLAQIQSAEETIGKNPTQYQYELGLAYEEGTHGLKKDINLALKWYRKAAAKRHALAQYSVDEIEIYVIGKDRQASKNFNNEFLNDKLQLIWCQKTSKETIAQYQYELGLAYEEGTHGLEKNINLALRWYQKAAFKGHPLAQYKLAETYFGTGVEQNFFLAKDYYKRFLSHPAGNTAYRASALYNLAMIYEHGAPAVPGFPELPIEPEKAEYYYRQASIAGSDKASYNLACMYFNKKSKTQEDRNHNLEKTLFYFKLSLSQGNEKAESSIKALYESGFVKRPETAQELLTPALDDLRRQSKPFDTLPRNNTEHAPEVIHERERPPTP